MSLRHESVRRLVVSLDADVAGSIQLGLSHFHDTGQYTAAMEDLLVLITVASKSVKNPNKAGTFHAPRFYTSEKMSLGDLTTLFVDNCTDPDLEFVEYLSTSMSHTRTKRVPLL